jgi:RNA polymerase sigma-32 factor
MNAAEVSAVAKDLNVSEREVMEMESRLSGRDIGFDAPTDEDDDHAPPSPAAFLVATTKIRRRPTSVPTAKTTS